MIVEAGDCDAPYMSTVWKDGEVVGETTSGRLGLPGRRLDFAWRGTGGLRRAGH